MRVFFLKEVESIKTKILILILMCIWYYTIC